MSITKELDSEYKYLLLDVNGCLASTNPMTEHKTQYAFQKPNHVVFG